MTVWLAPYLLERSHSYDIFFQNTGFSSSETCRCCSLEFLQLKTMSANKKFSASKKSSTNPNDVTNGPLERLKTAS